MKYLLLSAALALCPFASNAMQVSPLAQTISPEKNNGSLTVVNTSNERKEYQLQAFKWTLVDGKQARTPVDAIRFAPSSFYLEAGKSQVVRFINTETSSSELAYRVVVKEKNVKKLETTGIEPVFNMNFPLFWRASDRATVTARASESAIVLRNASPITAQIANLNYGSYRRDGLVGYLLPGEEMVISKGNATSVKALINGVVTELVIE
ncbi:TPA: fimbria/pilus periplasmic chaperone [Stenotrophomonas maltophilia]|uniref:fimbria/pilus periplasmic chaperone n=2 Tax=Bacteria TaxID=2 RepID=UPI000AD37ABB|nr:MULTISPECIES: fimbria/pilus periplasmic chaperone [Stenotrophomonas]MBA0443347.1 molecular chaperone [Stenotrophomonas maltophilia]TIL19753.1 molecular chaperone [Stenotrophomonas maltophilia]UQA24443.1 fimbria/pilus periplasmic chaperone [Stenotrophomonas sp. NY11291]